MSAASKTPGSATSGAATSVELSVIAPCYNEELNIPELSRRVLKMFDSGDVRGELLLIDDGSSDGTAQTIRDWEQLHPGRIIGCFHGTNKGIAAGWQTGVDNARGRNVVIIDSDLQYQPEDILRLYRTLLDHSVDIVQGWRSAIGRERGGRYNISRAYNVMLNRAFGMSLRDNKSGFICCSKEIMADLLQYQGFYYYWQSFIMVAAHAKGYSYKEVETLFESRKQGESFLDGSTMQASLKSLWDISRAAVEYRVKAPPKDVSEHFLRAEKVSAPAPASASKHRSRWRSALSVFNRTHKIITHDVERYYESLNKTQWMNAEALRALQDEKLRHLIRHAYRSVPYYRRRMQERGLRPEQIETQADLSRLPCVTRADVRENLYFDITADNISKANMLPLSTSGNTGEPGVFFADQRQLEFRWAARLRAKEWAGYAFGDRELCLWPRVNGSSERSLTVTPLARQLAGQQELQLSELPTLGLSGTAQAIESSYPTLVSGTGEGLLLVAQHLEQSGAQWKNPPRSVMSSSRTLTEEQRETIRQGFGAPVFEAYGARQFGIVAHECEAHAGLHIVAEGFIVELLVGDRPANSGEVGEIVVTDLNNYGMPLIRYRTGDFGRFSSESECPCGRGAPRIEQLQGRPPTLIEGVDGRCAPAGYFDDLFARYEYAFRKFRLTQTEPGSLSLRVVKGGRYSAEVMSRVEAEIRSQLGSGLQLQVELVDEIDGDAAPSSSVESTRGWFQTRANGPAN